MSFFMSRIAEDGFISSPPLSKVTPLPTKVTFGWSASPHCRSMSRGASAAARPTAWMAPHLISSSASPSVISQVAPKVSARACTSAARCEGAIS